MIGIVIVTHCQLGDSLIEAAEFIGITVDLARTRLFRAKHLLTKMAQKHKHFL